MEGFSFDEEAVSRKLTQIFENKSDHDAARMLIDEIEGDSGISGRCRVQLCVLKLAGADLGLVRHYVDAAHGDLRDVIAWAQYPEYMEESSKSRDKLDAAAVRKRDEKQFRDWLES